MTRVAPAERGRPADVLAYIDHIERDHLRSWALQFPHLSAQGRLRLLRADSGEATTIALGLLEGGIRIAQAEKGFR